MPQEPSDETARKRFWREARTAASVNHPNVCQLYEIGEERVWALSGLKIMDDPEAIFQQGWLLCDLGELESGLRELRHAVAKGYTVVPTLSGSRAFDALRSVPAFQELLAEAEAGRQQALAAFHEGGGERLLGR